MDTMIFTAQKPQELTSRSLLLDIMSIIGSAVMAVCWLDRSASGPTYHIQRSGHGLTWPNGQDATGLGLDAARPLVTNTIFMLQAGLALTD